MTGYTSIITGTIVMKSKSTTTTTSESYAQTVQNSFYANGEFVDSSQNYILEGTSVSCTSYGVNSPGSQFWEGVGIHVAGELEGESYASRYW